ncbi:sulfotransferase [Nocardioides sp.]|uniref:sulfotransferase family protein n=1 Tax=Nocardioides sp. TaxID=35761 RepID=UPI002B274B3A|nr:sulfotransferase [Nocardioides sp.]
MTSRAPAAQTGPQTGPVGEPLRYGFSIVGVQKAGTSTLSRAITAHPQVVRAPRKEATFFNDLEIDWTAPPYDTHVVPRAKPEQRIVGDATPAYLWWPHALAHMHDYNPDTRLIAVLRDPIDRAYSQWRMQRERSERKVTKGIGGLAEDWPEVVERYLDLPVPDEVTPSGFKGSRSIFSRGLYGEQLTRGVGVFAPEQWLVLEFGAMLSDFSGTLDRVTDHLALRRFRRPPPLRHELAGAEQVTGTAPTAAELLRIAERYAADLDVLTGLPIAAGIDVSRWPTRRLLDGDLDPADLAAKYATRVSRR